MEIQIESASPAPLLVVACLRPTHANLEVKMDVQTSDGDENPLCAARDTIVWVSSAPV